MQVRQARRRIDRAGLYSSKAQQVGQPGPAIVRAGNGLAVICLSFGAAFAAFASGSLEQRIGNLFFLGFIPAVAVYAGGHILGQLLVVSSKLCDVIIAGSFRYATLLLKALLSWVSTHVSSWLASLPAVRQKVCYSAHRYYGHVSHVGFDFSCLLIRSVARFAIRIEAFPHRQLATYRRCRALRQ
jgi:hypothetical protein